MKRLITLILFFLLFTAQYAFADVTNDYKVIPGQDYRVLLAEILDSDSKTIHRIYDEYSGTTGRIDYKGSMSYGRITYNNQYDILLPEAFSSLYEAKIWLQANDPEQLRLLPNTVVSEEVLNEWSKAHYTPLNEYWEYSRKGLVSYDLKTDYTIIPKPFLVEGLESPVKQNVQIYINKKRIQFGQNQPYIIDNSVLVPVKTIARKLGFTTQYIVNKNGIGTVILEKCGRTIEISPWKENINVYGTMISFSAVPRLSLHERMLVPIDLLYYMASDVEFDVQDKYVRIDIRFK